MKTKKEETPIVPESFRNRLKNIVIKECREAKIKDKYERDLVFTEALLTAEEEVIKEKPKKYKDFSRIIDKISERMLNHIEFLSGTRDEVLMYIGN